MLTTKDWRPAFVERSVAEAEVPKGKIRVSADVPVGRQLLLPIVPAFLEA
jgi:DNA-binding transcriptional LysR family regulator